jgi:hypothetical protein
LRDCTVSEKLPKIPLFGPSLIHQLRLLGSQQRLQSGVLLTSFSTWGTENSLADINLESTGVIKGCNIFLDQKLANICSFVSGRIIVQQEKILRAERSWTNPLNVLQEAIHCSFIKLCIYCFSLWYEFFVHYVLRVDKNYQHVLDAGPLEFQFLQPRGYLTNPFRTLLLCFGVIGKTPGLISCNNFVKKILSASAMAIMSWQDVTRSSLCLGVKECGTKRAHNFLFQNPKNYSLGDVQRFCYHS